jgi:hypothetical protein
MKNATGKFREAVRRIPPSSPFAKGSCGAAGSARDPGGGLTPSRYFH